MIVTNRTYNINGGVPPYTYTVSAGDSCVSFSPSGGTTTGLIEVQYTFAYESCFDTDITVSWTDSQGCPGVSTINVANPCDDFTLNSIGVSGSYVYTVTTSSPSCSSVSFQWVYSSALFDLVSQVDGALTSQLTLTPRNVALPSSTQIQVIATDCNGCRKATVYNETFCVPEAHDFAMTLYCLETEHGSGFTPIMTPVNCEASYDWTTLQVSAPSGFGYSTRNNNEIRFYAPFSVSSGIYIATYSVATTQGVRSDLGTITLTVVGCPRGETISIQNTAFTLPCDIEPGDIYEIVLDPLVFIEAPGVIDWGSAQLVTPPTPISPSITFAVNGLGQHVINYEVPDPIATDAFSWTVCDTNGDCAQAGIFSIIECAQPPITVDDDACVGCSQAVSIDVLDNDLGNGSPLNPSTLTIVTPPSNGVAVPSSGQIVYTANPGFSGNDTFTYTVQNLFGITSDPATVTVEVICAGGTATIVACGA